MNPYFGKNFLEFLGLFFERSLQFLTGRLPLSSLASDEVQIFSLICIGILTSLLGSFLVVRKMTMLANSLSHTILLGIVLSYLLLFHGRMSGFQIDLKVMLISAILAALLTSALTELLSKGLRLQEDASIGLVFTTLFALGVVLVTVFSRNTHIGAEVIMGNVDALHLQDLKLVFWICLGNLLFIAAFFKEFYLTTFDSGFAKSIGVSPVLFHYILMFLTAVAAIAAFRAVGVFLVLALLVGPPLSARLITNRLLRLIGASMGLSCISSICSVAISRHILSVHKIPLSTAGIMITLVLILYCLVVAATFLFPFFYKLFAGRAYLKEPQSRNLD
ncbi:MAG: hypothetical protein Tsb0015_14230 [Simkaniaceae bacterium]